MKKDEKKNQKPGRGSTLVDSTNVEGITRTSYRAVTAVTHEPDENEEQMSSVAHGSNQWQADQVTGHSPGVSLPQA